MKRLLATLLLVAANANANVDRVDSSITPEFDRSGQIMEIKVVFYDNIRDLREAREKEFGRPNEGFATRRGAGRSVWRGSAWSGWNNRDNYCEIHVLRPETGADDKVQDLGHELLHCVHGRYHAE